MYFEIECIPGTSHIVRQELERCITNIKILSHKKEVVLVGRRAPLEALLEIRSSPAIYKVLPFEIPRPKALLGHENFSKLVTVAKSILSDRFSSFRIEAAGKSSDVFQQLATELESALKLPFVEDSGDLQIRVRKAHKDSVWDVLFRISPRPLSVRSWKQLDFRGALDPCLASCMIQMLAPEPGSILCDLTLGSGTVLAEAYALDKSLELIGVELNNEHLAIAKTNLTDIPVRYLHEDARGTSLPIAKIDYIASNLPWGEAVLEKHLLEPLYQGILTETARLLKPSGKACFVTQRSDLLTALIAQVPMLTLEKQVKCQIQGGFSPSVFILSRGT